MNTQTNTKINVLKVQIRYRTTKRPSRSLLRIGKVAGVLNGKGAPSRMIEMLLSDVLQILRDPMFYNRLITIELDGEKIRVLPKSVDYEPVSGVPIHLEFLLVQEGVALNVSVPVKILNEEQCQVMRTGGTISILSRYVELRCLPDSLIDYLNVDVSQMELGQNISLKDTPLPSGVRRARGGDVVLVALIAPDEEETKTAEDDVPTKVT